MMALVFLGKGRLCCSPPLRSKEASDYCSNVIMPNQRQPTYQQQAVVAVGPDTSRSILPVSPSPLANTSNPTVDDGIIQRTDSAGRHDGVIIQTRTGTN